MTQEHKDVLTEESDLIWRVVQPMRGLRGNPSSMTRATAKAQAGRDLINRGRRGLSTHKGRVANMVPTRQFESLSTRQERPMLTKPNGFQIAFIAYGDARTHSECIRYRALGHRLWITLKGVEVYY